MGLYLVDGGGIGRRMVCLSRVRAGKYDNMDTTRYTPSRIARNKGHSNLSILYFPVRFSKLGCDSSQTHNNISTTLSCGVLSVGIEVVRVFRMLLVRRPGPKREPVLDEANICRIFRLLQKPVELHQRVLFLCLRSDDR